MMKFKNFLILFVGVLLVGGITYLGIRYTSNSQKTFYSEGYILSFNKSNSKSTRYNFSNDTNYKISYDNEISFLDVLDDNVRVPNTSFVHYNDGSISLLKKGVILNLDELSKANPKYYNLFQDDVLKFSNNTYYIDNLGKTLKFKRFIIKTDDDRYIIVGDGIKLLVDESDKISIKSNYVEVSYVNENVVKLENEDASYMTISKQASVYVDSDIKLSLNSRYFYKDNEASVNLNQIVINNDDNIDIRPLEENEEQIDENTNLAELGYDEQKAKEGTENSEGNNTTNEENITNNSETSFISEQGGLSGEEEQEEEVDENSQQIPTAVIEDIEVNANSVNINIKVNDPNSIITGDVVTSIIENATGKIIDQVITDAGNYSIDVFNENLKPNTTYNISTRVNYNKNDTSYSTDILSQLFTTEDIGISLEKDYFGSTSLSYNLNVENFSKVSSCSVNLYSTTGDLIKENNLTISNAAQSYQILFEELTPNTKYNVKIEDILYDSAILDDAYSIELGAKTLKVKPKYGDLGFVVDKKNSVFTLKINNINDLYNGIENYRYELYDARGDGTTPVAVYDKKTDASIDVKVDEGVIHRGVPYYYKVVLEFYDNEKYYEYITGNSSNMQMDGVEGPSMSFTADEITFERIKGNITIIDNNNTIDTTKTMTIQYSNSIGTVKSYTTTANMTIPFSVDNLRANETYTISVYASVNLQDGNDQVDMYHVGSASVQTNPTKPFSAQLQANLDNLSTAFTINGKLLNISNADNTLEATTLTGISFYLYEGTDTSGTLVKTVKKVDTDISQYNSNLKTAYYDNEFILNPEFFGLKNADLNSQFYTIVIDNAYDYTDFMNEIPIVNNTIVVKTNGYLPDLPVNPDAAIRYEYIRNKDVYNNTYSEHYDPNLENNTIVGIKAMPTYDNSKKYLKKINYKIWDANTNKEYTNYSKTSLVAADGTIEYVYFWFDKGTKINIEDNTLVRGHEYYLTYTGELDLNYDGTPETAYPSEDIILKSETISVPKQKAKFKSYPSTSDASSFTIKYQLDDYDSILYDNLLSAYISDSEKNNMELKSSVSINESSEYNTATFTDLVKGYLTLRYSYISIKKKDYGTISANPENYTSSEDVLFQKFDSTFTPSNISYTIETDINRLVIQLKNYDPSNETFARIAALKITFTCENNTIVKDNVIVDSSGITKIDFYDMAPFIGKNVTVSIQAYYDSGVTGYDVNTENYAIQAISNQFGGGEYYYINSLGNIIDDTTALRSIYTKTDNESYIRMKSNINNKTIDIEKNINSGGIIYNGVYILLKELKTMNLNYSGSNTFTFDKLIPGISLRDAAELSTIHPTIQTVSYTVSFSNANENNIKDSKVYLELYETDEAKSTLNLIRTIEYSLSELSETKEITGLIPGQNYGIKFKANIIDTNGNISYDQLYDVDNNTNNITYYFKTIDTIQIYNIKNKFKASSYTKKYIYISYDLNLILGYDRIKYTIYHLNSSGEYEQMNIDITPSTALNYNMAVQIPTPPGSEFIFGDSYKITITPYVDILVDGVRQEVELSGGVEYKFKLKKLSAPYIPITSRVTSDTTGLEGSALDFIVNVVDTDRIIPEGKYSIRVLDSGENDVTPESFKNKTYSIGHINQVYTIDGLVSGEKYTFYVDYQADLSNTGENYTMRHNSYTANALNKDEIDIGSVSASMNSTVNSMIDMTFTNSYRLTEIDTIRYSIYNADTGISQDNEIEFIPTARIIGNTSLYIITLPDILTETGIYYIQVQFLKDGELVNDGVTLQHTYYITS